MARGGGSDLRWTAFSRDEVKGIALDAFELRSWPGAVDPFRLATLILTDGRRIGLFDGDLTEVRDRAIKVAASFGVSLFASAAFDSVGLSEPGSGA